jgi:hypothetical protein
LLSEIENLHVHASSAGVCGSISDVAVVLVGVSYLLVDRNIF